MSTRCQGCGDAADETTGPLFDATLPPDGIAVRMHAACLLGLASDAGVSMRSVLESIPADQIGVFPIDVACRFWAHGDALSVAIASMYPIGNGEIRCACGMPVRPGYPHKRHIDRAQTVEDDVENPSPRTRAALTHAMWQSWAYKEISRKVAAGVITDEVGEDQIEEWDGYRIDVSVNDVAEPTETVEDTEPE